MLTPHHLWLVREPADMRAGIDTLTRKATEAAEDKQVPGERIFLKCMLYQLAQTIEGFTHVGDASNQPDAGT